MESKVKEAAQRKMCGYNCAQAVACTYCEQAGLDEETAKNLTQGFAVGMGGSMEATCGAIIGAVNVLGMINKNPQKTMQSARRIISRLERRNYNSHHVWNSRENTAITKSIRLPVIYK